MDVLKDRQSRNYPYPSRYAYFSLDYHTLDDKYIYEKTKQLSKNCPYVAHKIEMTDTLDSLSDYYYGRPDLYWVIADFNDIQDPFINLFTLPVEILKIPSLSNISY